MTPPLRYKRKRRQLVYTFVFQFLLLLIALPTATSFGARQPIFNSRLRPSAATANFNSKVTMVSKAVFAGSLPASVAEVAIKVQAAGVQLVTYECPSVAAALTEAGVAHTPTSVSVTLQDVVAVFATLSDPSNLGTHTLVRSAALQHGTVAVAVEAADYEKIGAAISTGSGVAPAERLSLASKALKAAAAADAALAAGVSKAATVLVVGNGGREHALALKLAESPLVSLVYVAPGNGGTASAGGKVSNAPVSVTDTAGLVALAKSKAVNLVVVGPEVPLVAGLSDAMAKAGIKCFGPSAAAAKLEASKAFSKDFMVKYGIRTARYENFTDAKSAKAHVEAVDYPVVVKASGLAAGKGVIIPQNKAEAVAAVESIMVSKEFGDAGSEVVIEEFLTGEEVSILALCDGKTCVCMPGAQDHKRALDGDNGLNTGGMGAYAPAPCLTPKLRDICAGICQASVTAMAKEGTPFVGVLFAGFMLTSTGPVVLEYNVRMGDPETQVVLPLLQSDLYEVMLACVEGKLADMNVTFRAASAATVVMAAGGYPETYPKGMPIKGLDAASAMEGVTVYHAGTTLSGETVQASGGRVLSVTGVGADLAKALSRAYAGVRVISFDPCHFRSDIGHRVRSAPLRIGVLASGGGTALQPVLDAIAAGKLNAEVALLICNKPGMPCLERASKAGIATLTLEAGGKDRVAYDAAVTSAFSNVGVELVMMVGYMRIVSGQFCRRWAHRCINVHPSLLPEFAGGMDMAVHEAVIAAGKKKSGCTVHFVTESVDGGPICVQKEVTLAAGETAASLRTKVQTQEGLAFIEAIEMFMSGKIGPRTPLSVSYKDAGVDIDAGNALVERIKPACKSTIRPGCDADLGGFGGLFDLAAAGYDSSETILIGATDGVGTKLKIAQTVGDHRSVGIDLVAMCVNDLIVAGGEPLFFLDYYATGKLTIEEAAVVVESIAEGCRQSNCGLIGGETAEMPSMYPVGEYDLAGFAVGAVNKGAVLPLPLSEGDVVLGLRSSGVHSNGFSLVRKVIEVSGLTFTDKAPFDPEGKSLADNLLIPTRIYVRMIMPLLKKKLLKALAHITGGGLPENIPRVLSKDLACYIDVKGSGWTLPPVFKWLRTAGGIPQEELLRALNCGIGMILVVSNNDVAETLTMLRASGEEAMMLGSIIKRASPDSPQVVVDGEVP